MGGAALAVAGLVTAAGLRLDRRGSAERRQRRYVEAMGRPSPDPMYQAKRSGKNVWRFAA